MMTSEEYELLLTDEVQRAIAVSRGRDPLDVALERWPVSPPKTSGGSKPPT